MSVILSFLSSILGSSNFGSILMLGVEWYLRKQNTDAESRRIAVDLAMSLRRQGVTDVVLSFESEKDANEASNEWDKKG